MIQLQTQIALFIYNLNGGGAERVMVNLAHNFSKKGLKVDLVLATATGPYLSQVSPEVRIVDFKTTQMLASLPKLVSYLQKEKPKTLLSAMHYANEIALLAKSLARVSTQVVVSEQTNLSQDLTNENQIKKWLTPMSTKLLYPWANGIVAASRETAEDLADITGLPSKRIQFIYNPVITPELQEKAKEPVNHPWFASGEPPVILGAGRFTKQKDFPTLVRAFAQVRQIQPARLMILGDRPKHHVIDNLVRELGLENDVATPGFVENPYAYMARAAVFVLSSAWEGFGNVLAEAMAVKTSVVSTNCKSGPAEILDYGKYGSLVAVGNHQAMAEEILKVLSGETKPVDSAWLSQFQLETVSQKYLQILGMN